MRRFYIPPEHIGKNESVLEGDDAHHLRVVLKMQPGDLVVVFDGKGREYKGRIVSINQRQSRIAILEQLDSHSESTLDMTIAQGYLKDKKMDVVVRQLTEIGVTRWVPFLSVRSIPAPKKDRLQGRYQRWRKISLESLKQCGRSCAMDINQAISFSEAIRLAAPCDLKLIFWEESKYTTMDQIGNRFQPNSLFIMVGPEGGFDEKEVALAKSEGFEVVGMGPRILKAETAALAAAIMAQSHFGDI